MFGYLLNERNNLNENVSHLQMFRLGDLVRLTWLNTGLPLMHKPWSPWEFFFLHSYLLNVTLFSSFLSFCSIVLFFLCIYDHSKFHSVWNNEMPIQMNSIGFLDNTWRKNKIRIQNWNRQIDCFLAPHKNNNKTIEQILSFSISLFV